MERREILNVVIKHLRLNVDGLDGEPIDASRSMMDMGATSLDVVEVLTASMHELKIKVPRSELAGLKNIDELVDLFHEVKRRTP
jgi:acyl carrier protein